MYDFETKRQKFLGEVLGRAVDAQFGAIGPHQCSGAEENKKLRRKLKATL